jgi:hypothetical protein
MCVITHTELQHPGLPLSLNIPPSPLSHPCVSVSHACDTLVGALRHPPATTTPLTHHHHRCWVSDLPWCRRPSAASRHHPRPETAELQGRHVAWAARTGCQRRVRLCRPNTRCTTDNAERTETCSDVRWGGGEQKVGESLRAAASEADVTHVTYGAAGTHLYMRSLTDGSTMCL